MSAVLPVNFDVRTAKVLDSRCVGTTSNRSDIADYTTMGLLRYESNSDSFVYHDGTGWETLESTISSSGGGGGGTVIDSSTDLVVNSVTVSSSSDLHLGSQTIQQALADKQDELTGTSIIGVQKVAVRDFPDLAFTYPNGSSTQSIVTFDQIIDAKHTSTDTNTDLSCKDLQPSGNIILQGQEKLQFVTSTGSVAMNTLLLAKQDKNVYGSYIRTTELRVEESPDANGNEIPFVGATPYVAYGFDSVNQSGNYMTNGKSFTIPSSGTYILKAHAIFDDNVTPYFKYCYLHFEKAPLGYNATPINSTIRRYRFGGSANDRRTDELGLSIDQMFYLIQGDVITLVVEANPHVVNNNTSSSNWRIYPHASMSFLKIA